MERRVPREIWVKRVARWRESGQTALDFAAAYGLNADRLRHWGWRLERELEPATPTVTPPPTESSPNTGVVVPFVEVQRAPTTATRVKVTPTTKPEPTTESIEIITPSGLRVRVPSNFNDDALRRVLAAVR
jgi:hypothetical protein